MLLNIIKINMQNNKEKIKLIILKNENSNIYSEKDISLWLKEYFFYKYNKNENVEFSAHTISFIRHFIFNSLFWK